jgi:tetratricopeptide (TPR) repeat protein
MWNALAQVYENSDRKSEAVQCLQRALRAADGQAETADSILHDLTTLEQALGRYADAARSMRRALANGQALGRPAAELASGWLFLARFELGLFDGVRGPEADSQEEDERARREPNWALAASYLNAVVAHVRPDLPLSSWPLPPFSRPYH